MRFCGGCGAPLSELQWEPAAVREEVDAQRRHITVMFCDVVDSTSIAEALDPEDFRELVSSYHAACERAVERFDGYVAQYQGDGAIAYFGYPRAHEDDARRGVHAAFELLEEVDALNERLAARFDLTVQVRVGLHTGIVIAGDIGRLAHERHSVVGDTVHIAARVQTFAKADTVVVTDATLPLLGDGFDVMPLGTERLKGISHPVGLHTVLGPSSADGSHADAAGEARVIVDRADEMERLTVAWHRARQGHGALVHIIGEAGIGKTRLVQALREEVRGEGYAERILQCSPHYASTALHPVIRFLERLIDLDRTEAPEAQLHTLGRFVTEADLEPGQAAPLLADLLSIPGAQPLPEMMARDTRSALLRTLEALLVGEGAPHPLLLVVEDVHWADPTTVELLQRIIAALTDLPVQCVLTFRREFRPPWAEWHDVLEVELGPLSGQHVREIARAAGPAELDPDALSKVESAAEGVPLFIEELVKAAFAQGGLPPERSIGGVPATLRGLLAERLDRLPALAGVIDVAAVLGREFDQTLAEELSPFDSARFRSAVAQLTAEDVLRPVEGSRSRLEFKHALLHEAAYDRLLHARRRALHGQVASALTAHTPSEERFEPERIAHHLSCAEMPEEALTYWEQAGRRALKRAAFLEAAEHFRRSLEALDATRTEPDGDLERAELLTNLGATLQAGRTPATDVEAVYSRARSAYERLGRREGLIPVIRGQYLFHQSRAQYLRALALGEEMLAMGREERRPQWVAEGQFYVGFTRMMRGERDLARAELEQAVRSDAPSERSEQIFEAQNDPHVSALAYLAPLLWSQGYEQEAFEKSRESLELAEELGGPVTLALAWGLRCALLIVAGRWDELGPWLEKTRAHSLEHNIGYWNNVCSMWAAAQRVEAGDVEPGTALIERHLEDYRRSGGRVGIAGFECLLAAVHLATGSLPQAMELLGAAQEHIDATGERYSEPEVQWLLARTLLADESADRTEAAVAFGRAARSARAQNARVWELRALTGLAVLQRETGAPPTVLARVTSLCEWFGPDSQIAEVRWGRGLLGAEGRSA